MRPRRSAKGRTNKDDIGETTSRKHRANGFPLLHRWWWPTFAPWLPKDINSGVQRRTRELKEVGVGVSRLHFWREAPLANGVDAGSLREGTGRPGRI
jgi:hypothetical protein